MNVPAKHVRAYDPTSYQRTASQRWVDLHRAYRERFLYEISAIPITHRAFRMRRLQQAFDEAWDSGNSGLGLKLLEQADKEIGNWFVR